MSVHLQTLKDVMGIVVEVQRDKAIIAFGHDGRQEQALLKKERLTVWGRHVCDESLMNILSIGTIVKVWCHNFPEMELEECAWFVTHAIKQGSCQVFGCLASESVVIPRTTDLMPGQHGVPGTIFEVYARKGVIVSSNGSCNSDENYKIFFTASKLVLFGKTVDENQKLSEIIKVGEPVFFDAIPIHPQENLRYCEWFATLVWQGKRPSVQNIPALRNDVGLKHLLTDAHNLQFMLYQVASDPKAMFLKTEARVMFLINNEFGVAMLFMKPNVMMSALFHKSVCYFFGHNLKNCDLRKFLKEGDHIKFVGVEAPPGLISNFVATQIVISMLK